MSNTRLRAAAAVAALGILLGAAPLSAQFEVQADVNSRYIWRGFDLLWNNTPAFQPSLTYSFGESGFSVNVWTSFALADRDAFQDLDEVDLTLDYTFAVSEQVEMSLGFIAYAYPFWPDFTIKNDVTEEFYVAAGLPGVFLSPTLTAYYDVNLGTGLYLNLQGSHSIPLSETVGLDLSAGLGYNSKLYIDESGFSDLSLCVTLPIKIGDWTIAPHVNYSFVFLESVNDENEFWFGISIIR